MRPDLDLRLYAIVDVRNDGLAIRPEAIEEALAAGVTALQVRGKECTPRRTWLAARALAPLCKRHRALLFVNDRPDLALAAGADGVHLGQRDVPAGQVRRSWPGLRVGVSVHDLTELQAAAQAGVDYVASGSLYPTPSKDDARPLDHELFRRLTVGSPCPVVGIGGITPGRAREVANLGAAGVAVISGLWLAQGVGAAAAEYRRAFP